MKPYPLFPSFIFLPYTHKNANLLLAFLNSRLLRTHTNRGLKTSDFSLPNQGHSDSSLFSSLEMDKFWKWSIFSPLSLQQKNHILFRNLRPEWRNYILKHWALRLWTELCALHNFSQHYPKPLQHTGKLKITSFHQVFVGKACIALHLTG